MELLSAHHLSIAIDGKSICRELELTIRAGERWAILGPNGSGKTTLLHTLAGLRPAQGGEIILKGRSLNDWQTRERARIVGTLLQHHDDPFPSKVLETTLIGRHPHLERWQWEGSDDQERARSALQTMALAGFEARSVATLSGGERQRLAIATLLTQDPRIFLLDEPTNHLDLYHQVHALQLLTRLATREACALVMALHDITSAVRYCDHALLLFAEGKTLAGRTEKIVNEENLLRLYGHPVHRLMGPEGEVWTPAYTGI
jgi:iron complex transport system ATP-binding protein